MDLNGDGHLDMLSGSWPGELFLFRGGPKRTFAAPEMIKNTDGDYINIGGGIQERNNSILITGNGKFEKTKDGTFVSYHGKRLKSTPEKPISITGTASAAHAVDWDGDGDYDILVGDIGGNVYLLPNEGTAKSYAFGDHKQLLAGGKPIRVSGGDAGPFTADWDGDGLRDLIVGAGDGSVVLFRNSGTAKKSKLAKAQQLVPPGKTAYGADAPKEPTRGVRAKVCVTDFNGDGRLDLLVGDFATQKPDLPEPTAKQKAEHDKIRKELQTVQQRWGDLVGKLYIGTSRVRDKNQRKKLEKELEQVREQMDELQSKIPPEYESHGWVWLFLRK